MLFALNRNKATTSTTTTGLIFLAEKEHLIETLSKTKLLSKLGLQCTMK